MVEFSRKGFPSKGGRRGGYAVAVGLSCILLFAASLAAPETNLASSTFDAEFVSQSVPTWMFPGVAYNVSVTMKNTGLSAWVGRGWGFPTQTILSVLPQNDLTWGRSSDGLSDDDLILNGDTKEFTFIIIAPIVPGDYDFQWQMAEAGVLFGDASTNVSVHVGFSPP